MSWARLDDMRADNPKLMAAGFEARGLDETAICWSSRHQTDGHITCEAVAMLAQGHGCRQWRKVVDRLVKVGRWVPEEGGWEIHDYLEFNPSKADLDTGKQRKRESGRLGGIRSGEARRSGTSRSKTEASASSKTEASASFSLADAANPRPVPSRRDKSSVVTTAPRDPAPVENDDDDDDPADVEKALEVIAERRMDRAGKANITNLAGYRRSVVASLRTELADKIDQAPDFDTIDQLIDWLEPPAPVEAATTAQARIRERNDRPPCAECDGNGWIETDSPAGFTVSPCPECQKAAAQ